LIDGTLSSAIQGERRGNTMKALNSMLAVLVLGCVAAPGQAGPVGPFDQTTLVSNATDPDLVNPWGVSFSATSPFWVSDNGTGRSTLYNSLGVKQGLVVAMPSGAEPVTGQVFNGTSSFNGDTFVFASENGTIAGWRGALGTTAETLFASAGANYKGLAISTDKSTLYAANFAIGTVDIFDSTGRLFSVVDPTLPAGYRPFNVQNVAGKLYVTFAFTSDGHDDLAGAGHGFVKVFDPASRTFANLVAQGPLDSPWGLAVAPVGFGALGGDLLVGNFGDGKINAFDPATGTLVGTLADASSNPLVIDGLWGLAFGNGGNGGSSASLYLTAGPNDETGGLFARIDSLAAPVPEPEAWALMLGGLALLHLRRRQRARHAVLR
jgi:uncharacterized protein (TIGR03118 family)